MSKTARKMARVKERGGGGEEMEELPLSFLPLPFPPPSFFGFRSVSLSHFRSPNRLRAEETPMISFPN